MDLIALNLPVNYLEKIIIEALKKGSSRYNDFYSNVKIKFCKNSNHLNAIFTFDDEDIIKKVYSEFNGKTIDGIFFDLIYSAKNVEDFLKNNKKILYFKLHSIKLIDINLNIQKYGPIQKLDFNDEKRIGYIIFENTEKALKAMFELEHTLPDSSIDISFEAFNESFSNFLNLTKKRNIYVKYDLLLEKGNDSSIFVFDIPKTNEGPIIDEDFLRQLFEEFEISSVSFHKRYDYDSKISWYAIIIFKDRQSALNAIRDYNYTKLDGVPIRLVLADDCTRKIISTNKGKLIIKNIDKDIEVSQLDQVFANYGEVVECEIPTDNRISRGYGYVQFKFVKDAELARTDLNDASINGVPFTVDFLEEFTCYDLQKYFLFIHNNDDNNNNSNDFNSSLFDIDFSLFDHIVFDFIIYVNENQIACNRLMASFLSPKIANNESLSEFVIKIFPLDQGFSMVYEIASFLLSLLNKKNCL